MNLLWVYTKKVSFGGAFSSLGIKKNTLKKYLKLQSRVVLVIIWTQGENSRLGFV